jgi:hypothetical protein
VKQFFFVCSILGMLGWSLLWAILGLASCANMATSVDTTNQYATAGAGLGIMIGGGFIGFIWFIGFVALCLLALLLKPSKEDKLLAEIKHLREAEGIKS